MTMNVIKKLIYFLIIETNQQIILLTFLQFFFPDLT